MTFFYIQGLNQQDRMPLETAFSKNKVQKIERTKPLKPVDPEYVNEAVKNQQDPFSAGDAYRGIEKLVDEKPVLFAHQIMQKHVVTLSSGMKIEKALTLFQKYAYRHFPVVITGGQVAGMISDRDIFQYLAGLNKAEQKKSIQIEQLMKSPVITANQQTDIRYIARLFVEQHIGAITIVDEGALRGIITRSDILIAVVEHYQLELWV
jgi:acetoin utilization protein AcuB